MSNYKKLSYEEVDGVAKVGFGYNCDKSMTVLDEETLRELNDLVDDVTKRQKDLNAVIFFTHKDRCFLAGADINLISGIKTEAEGAEGAEAGQLIFNKIEDLKIPTVACVHGVCMGGGTEFSLSCKTILVSDDSSTQMALPEVKLGLIPGFGGTYRMPRRVGLPKALDLILTGKSVRGSKIVRMGLADEIYPKERLIDMAIERHIGKDRKKHGIKESLADFASDNFLSRKIIFQKARENVLKVTKGFYQAPLKILDTMEAGMMKGRSSYLASEAQAFGELCVGEQSKNLQHIFFMVEAAKKYNGPKGGELPKLERGAVLGAGTMGGGIAWLMADNGFAPIMKDLNIDALELGLKQSSSNFKGAVKRKRMTYDEFERKQRSISAQTDFTGFNRVDLLIEAIVEDMNIKKKVFADTEKHLSEDCLITSNTSSLSVQEMAGALERPERFAGLHFFNPVHRMPLVEIITHDKVAPETVEALYKWCHKVKKTPVVVKDGPGFLVNRILMPYLNEAGFLLEEGVPMKDIESACLNFGMPMGPCRLLDEVGIDVAVKVAKILHDGLGDRAKASPMSGQLVEKGFLGKKNKSGFYLYDESGKEDGINEEVQSLLPSSKKSMDEVDIQKRVFLPMINEASIILEEGIVTRASDVDLGLIFGIGFPPFRGGLLRYADAEGLERILDAINQFSQEVDFDRYQASNYLKDLVAKKKKFYDEQ